MTIDEEIMKLDLIASDAFEGGNKNEFIQLAEWLKELKFYKDRQDLINKKWQEVINYKEGVEKIKMRSQAYRECGENILASGMEQALDILKEVNADDSSRTN